MNKRNENIIDMKGEYEYIGFVQNMVKTLGKENKIIIFISNLDLGKGTINSLVKAVVKTWRNMHKSNEHIIDVKGEYEYIGFVPNMVKT